jgi:bifunctional non-homologous end joining protein LigD
MSVNVGTRPMKTATLYYGEGSSDKQYTATVDGGTVTFAWGRRGSTLQTDAKTLTAAEAEQLYHSTLKEKLAKGYRLGEDVASLATKRADPDVQKSSDGQTYGRQSGTSYRPMLLNSVGPDEAEALIGDPNWFMQQKADGFRAIVTIDHLDGTVRAASRTGKPVALTVAIINALNDVFPHGAVLDAESCGETLVIFDVVRIGNSELSDCSCELRLHYLETIARGNKYGELSFMQTARTKTQKRYALKLLVGGGAEGVVFKDRNAPYSAGRPHTGGPALKWKFISSASVIVAGHHRRGKRSVEMALRDGTLVGHVTIPAKHGRLPLIGTIIEVGYLYAFRGGSLAQSVYKGIRSDVDADSAEQLQYKGEARK